MFHFTSKQALIAAGSQVWVLNISARLSKFYALTRLLVVKIREMKHFLFGTLVAGLK
jgi:hypothetical protein